MDALENEPPEVRNNSIFLLSPLAVAAISFGPPALCVGTGMRGTAWGHCTPKTSLWKIPPSKTTCNAQGRIQIFPPGSSTPWMAFPSAEFPTIEGLFLAQAEVFVTKEKTTFVKELHKLNHHPNPTFCSRNCCTPELL